MRQRIRPYLCCNAPNDGPHAPTCKRVQPPVDARDEQIATLTRQLAEANDRADAFAARLDGFRAWCRARKWTEAVKVLDRYLAGEDPCPHCPGVGGQHKFSCPAGGARAVVVPVDRVPAREQDDRPMLTAWSVGDYGRWLRHCPAHDRNALVAERNGQWAVWNKWMVNTSARRLAHGIAADIESAKRAADSAARQFYRLPEDITCTVCHAVSTGDPHEFAREHTHAAESEET